MYKNKNVLVAGGTGAIGYHIVKKLLDLGANIKVVSYDTKEYADMLFGHTVEFTRQDLTDFQNCMNSMKDVDYVFNLVGIKGSISNNPNLSNEFMSYLRFQSNIMEAALKSNISKFLFVGSICSYPQMSVPKKEDDMWNGLPMQNDKYQGIAKRLGETQAMLYYEHSKWDGIRIVRPSNCYGPYDDFNVKSAQVIPALISKIINGENVINVIGDGSGIRDFIYMADVADGILQVFEKGLPSDPINLGSGQSISIKRITEILTKIFDDKISFNFDGSKYSGDPIRVLSTEKCKEQIGFECKVDIEEGLRKTIEWYRNNKQITLMKGKYDAK